MKTLGSFLLLAALGCAVPLVGQSAPLHDCGTMRLETADVTNFWHAFDSWQEQDKGDPTKLEAVLQREYLDKASPGLTAFIPYRVISSEELAKTILADTSYYREIRAASQSFLGDAPRLLEKCKAMQAIYSGTKVPAIYVVIGRRNSGGTSADAGLIIGAEMFSPRASARLHPDDFVALVAHELVHYQQKVDKQPENANTLLRAAMVEGAADFIAERLAGHDIDEAAKPYADAHEQELWESFKKNMYGHSTQDWLYQGSEKNGMPPDLGYYEGYKICQSFLETQTDKAAALRQILLMEDEAAILNESHYADRFHCGKNVARLPR